jgi:hypothetical protein
MGVIETNVVLAAMTRYFRRTSLHQKRAPGSDTFVLRAPRFLIPLGAIFVVLNLVLLAWVYVDFRQEGAAGSFWVAVLIVSPLLACALVLIVYGLGYRVEVGPEGLTRQMVLRRPRVIPFAAIASVTVSTAGYVKKMKIETSNPGERALSLDNNLDGFFDLADLLRDKGLISPGLLVRETDTPAGDGGAQGEPTVLSDENLPPVPFDVGQRTFGTFALVSLIVLIILMLITALAMASEGDAAGIRRILLLGSPFVLWAAGGVVYCRGRRLTVTASGLVRTVPFSPPQTIPFQSIARVTLDKRETGGQTLVYLRVYVHGQDKPVLKVHNGYNNYDLLQVYLTGKGLVAPDS